MVRRRVRLTAENGGDFAELTNTVRVALASSLAENGMHVLQPGFQPAPWQITKLRFWGIPEWLPHLREMFSHQEGEDADYVVQVHLDYKIEHVKPAVGEFRWVERQLDGSFKREGTDRYKELVPVVQVKILYTVFDGRDRFIDDGNSAEGPKYLLGTAWPGFVSAIQVVTAGICRIIGEAEARRPASMREAA